MVQNKSGEGGICAYMRASSFKCNVEGSEGGQACRVGVSLIIRVKDVDENT